MDALPMFNTEQQDDVTARLGLGTLRAEHGTSPAAPTPGDGELTPGPRTYQERFGRYLLLEKLGSGGMAEVFKAVAEGAHGFRRAFVVKRILPAFADSPYFVSLFADEAKLSGMLHHPNLVPVYEFGVVAGIHYLSMEFLDGMDLVSVMSRLARAGERLPPSTAAFIAQQVAHGLAYAHAAKDETGTPFNLVHRDVSPENIMLLEAGAVKLFDFGIAFSDRRLASSVTQGKVLKGKLRYISPERIMGRALDGRSDIFSLGVVIWEMLAGRKLFAGEDDARTIYSVLERPIPPPSTIAPDVPKEFDAVVLKALARNPEDRYPTADHLAEDLDAVLRLIPHHRTDIPRLLARVRAGQVKVLDETLVNGATSQMDTEVGAHQVPSERTLAETRIPEVAPVQAPAVDDSMFYSSTKLSIPVADSWRDRIRLIPIPVQVAVASLVAFLSVFGPRAFMTATVSPGDAKNIHAPSMGALTQSTEATALTCVLPPAPVIAQRGATDMQASPKRNRRLVKSQPSPKMPLRPRRFQMASGATGKPAFSKVESLPRSGPRPLTYTAAVLDNVHVDPFDL